MSQPLELCAAPTALVEQLAAALRERRLLLVSAESCTGGMIAAACTDLAGSSQWFDRGFITYSNAAKMQMLGVPPNVLRRYGAVSPQTAQAMARGAIDALTPSTGAKPDGGARSVPAGSLPAGVLGYVSVAVTGVAGPGAGSPAKPVGTVCFGFCVEGVLSTCTQHFAGDRAAVRAQTVRFALGELLGQLESRFPMSRTQGHCA